MLSWFTAADIAPTIPPAIAPQTVLTNSPLVSFLVIGLLRQYANRFVSLKLIAERVEYSAASALMNLPMLGS